MCRRVTRDWLSVTTATNGCLAFDEVSQWSASNRLVSTDPRTYSVHAVAQPVGANGATAPPPDCQGPLLQIPESDKILARVKGWLSHSAY